MRKVGLQLEKSTFVFAHAAPSADTGLGDTLRLPDRCDKEVIYKAICPGWQVAGQSYDLKTCSLFIPSGLVSVDAGKPFRWAFAISLARDSVGQWLGFIESCMRNGGGSSSSLIGRKILRCSLLSKHQDHRILRVRHAPA